MGCQQALSESPSMGNAGGEAWPLRTQLSVRRRDRAADTAGARSDENFLGRWVRHGALIGEGGPQTLQAARMKSGTGTALSWPLASRTHSARVSRPSQISVSPRITRWC